MEIAVASHHWARIELDSEQALLRLYGEWTLQGINQLNAEVLQSLPAQQPVRIDGSDIAALDSAGAWKLQSLLRQIDESYGKVTLHNFSLKHRELIELVASKAEEVASTPIKRQNNNFFYSVGEITVQKCRLLLDFVDFIGEVTLTGLHILLQPKRIQLKSILSTIETTGYQALPIIGLLSFLIGVVLAYQMGLQLKTYGANMFIVELSGMAILREFAPLITAIIMAGRTASAFTAQIGTMKVNEEIDALRTMGLSPINRLVLPKLVGALIATPLLTVWSMVFGVMGSMVMSKWMLNIHYHDFISRFQVDVGLSDYVVGLIKTPVFALIVAGVGCFRGFQVLSNADSIGQQTTKSVVQAIFLIIVADAIFSVIFSWQGV